MALDVALLAEAEATSGRLEAGPLVAKVGVARASETNGGGAAIALRVAAAFSAMAVAMRGLVVALAVSTIGAEDYFPPAVPHRVTTDERSELSRIARGVSSED